MFVPVYFAYCISPTPATETPGEKVASPGGSPWWRVAPTEFGENTPCLWHAKAAQRYKGNESSSVASPPDNSQTPCRQPFASHFRLSQEREMPGRVKRPDSARPRLGVQMQDDAAAIVQVVRYMRQDSPCGSFYSSAHLLGCALRPRDRAMFCSAGGVSRIRQRKERREPRFLCIAAHTGCYRAGWAGKWFRASPW